MFDRVKPTQWRVYLSDKDDKPGNLTVELTCDHQGRVAATFPSGQSGLIAVKRGNSWEIAFEGLPGRPNTHGRIRPGFDSIVLATTSASLSEPLMGQMYKWLTNPKGLGEMLGLSESADNVGVIKVDIPPPWIMKAHLTEAALTRPF